MEHFLKKKKNVLKVFKYENDLSNYVDIYKNSENNIYNIYLNIYKAYNKRVEKNTLFSEDDRKNENLREVEKKIKSIIEKKEVNDNKEDKSIKRSIDLLIYPCVYDINKNENYYTCSCCSGRIIIFSEVNEKNEGFRKSFLNVLLNKKLYDSENLKNTLEKNSKEEVFFKYFKKNFIINNKEEKKYISDIDSTTTIKRKTIDNYQLHFRYKEKKLHKKNVHIFYVSHSHINLEYDINYIRKILIKKNFTNNYDFSENKNKSFLEDDKTKTHKEIKTNIEEKNNYKDSFTDDDNLKKYIKNTKEGNTIYIKFEPFIIHVKCIDLLNALKLLKIAQCSGLKQSGILNFGKNVTVAIRGSVRMEHFLGNSTEIREYNLARLINICNNKMTKNLMQLIHFYECYKKFHTQNDYHFNFNNEIATYVEYQEHHKENKKCLMSTGKQEELYGLKNENTEHKISLKKKRKKEINLNSYNIELSKDNYIINKNLNMDKKKLLQWRILTSTGDIDKFFVWGHDMFIHKNKIYIFGGFSKGIRNNKLKIYDIKNKEFLIHDTVLPSLVFHTFLNLDDNFAFIFGGRKNPQNCINQLWIYNIKSNSWILATNWYNFNKDRHIISLINNKVDNIKVSKQSITNEKEIFNFEESVPCARYRHSCVFVKRCLKKKNNVYIFYMYGGVNDKNEILNDIWEGKIIINQEKNEAFVKWNKKNCSNINEAFCIKNHTMIYNKKKNCIFIIGGYRVHQNKNEEEENLSINKNECNEYMNALNETTHLNDGNMKYLYSYDIKRDNFFFMQCKEDEQFSYPSYRFSHSTCLLDYNFFFLIGGIDTHKALNDIWLFHIKNKKWYYLGNFPFQNMYVRSKIVFENNFIYIIGGGCTVFTFGSFFDLPIYADCKKVIDFYKNCNNIIKESNNKELIKKNNISGTREIINRNTSTELYIEQKKNAYNNNSENYMNNKIIHVKKNEEFSYIKKNMDEIKKGINLIKKPIAYFNDGGNHFLENEDNKKEQFLNYYYFQKEEKVKRKSTIYYKKSLYHKNKGLYIFVKNKKFVKQIKMLLENIGNFDNSRKIYFSSTYKTDIRYEGYFIPVKKKFDIYKNYECLKNILDKIEIYQDGEIFYIERKETKKNMKKNNFKNKLRNVFNKFVNTDIKNYITDLERELILKAYTKYEIIGNILIFHYTHLESVIKLYRKYKNYLKKNSHKIKNMPHKYKLKNLELSHILNKYKYKNLMKKVKYFWITLKNLFNNYVKKYIYLKKNNTFKKLMYLSRRNIKRMIFPKGAKEFRINTYYKINVNLLKIKKEEEEKNKIKSIAIYKKVEGKLRRNKIYLVHGRNLKTVHTENNVAYKLNLKKCMFSSGNGTERQRIKNIYLSGNNFLSKENVVDLFCGVGYFTLPLLKFVDKQICNYFACDKNPDSLKLLKKAIKLNKIKKKNLYIIKQDSFLISKNIHMVRKCHRIILGLLPESVKAWNNAFTLLDNKNGGILHIHGIGENCFNDDFLSVICTNDYKNKNKFLDLQFIKNLTISDLIQNDEKNNISNKKQMNTIQKYYHNYNKNKTNNLYLGNNVPVNLNFAQFALLEFFKIALQDYIFHKNNWIITILNVERVKSYAPRIYHFVVDIRCTPEFI